MAAAVLRALVRAGRAGAWPVLAGRGGLQLSPGVGRALPGCGGARGVDGPCGVCARRVSATRRVDRGAAHGGLRMNALASVDATPGLAAYMAELELRLAQAVGRREGFASAVAGEALAAGGKRLRPLLCFLSASDRDSELLLAAGVAAELVHMAT